MESTGLKRIFNSKTITLLILLAVIIAFFSVAAEVTHNGTFFSLSNIRSILNTMVIVALLTIGAGCLMISGNLDLSAGYVGTLCGVLIAFFLSRYNMPWFPALILTVLAAVVFGLFNAFLINELKLQAFIATLATGYIAEGLSFGISGGQALTFNSEQLSWLGSGRLGSGKVGSAIPVAIVLALALFIIYGIIMSKTKFGRSAYLVGGNQAAARLTGLNPKRISYILFVNSSALAAIAGVILASRMKSATYQGIKSSNFSGVTAAILGGISFGGGAGGMGGAFLGLLIINTFNNGMSIMKIQTYYQNIAGGLLLILALALDYLAARRELKRRG